MVLAPAGGAAKVTKEVYTLNHAPLWKTIVFFEGAQPKGEKPKEDYQKPKGTKKYAFRREGFPAECL